MEVMASGLQFPEGPIAMPDGSVILVEIGRGTISRVQPNGSVEVVSECGGGPNGIAFGPDGRLYVCNNGGFATYVDSKGRTRIGSEPDSEVRLGYIQAIDLESGVIETLYTQVEDRHLRGPNDIVFDRFGGFWFTDHGKTWERERDRTGVFYAKADGSYIEEVIFPMEGPNGVGLSPDESELYVAETPTGRLWAFALAAPGKLAGERVDRPDGGRLLKSRDGYFMFDSLAVDADGRVCVATLMEGGITIFDPTDATAQPDFVPMPDRLTTNICFGGEDMRTAYLTGSRNGTLLKTTWDVPGHRLHFNPY